MHRVAGSCAVMAAGQVRFARTPASDLRPPESRPTARRPRLTAHGSRLTAHSSWPVAHESRGYGVRANDPGSADGSFFCLDQSCQDRGLSICELLRGSNLVDRCELIDQGDVQGHHAPVVNIMFLIGSTEESDPPVPRISGARSRTKSCRHTCRHNCQEIRPVDRVWVVPDVLSWNSASELPGWKG